jgi:hypothetical protein
VTTLSDNIPLPLEPLAKKKNERFIEQTFEQIAAIEECSGKFFR